MVLFSLISTLLASDPVLCARDKDQIKKPGVIRIAISGNTRNRSALEMIVPSGAYHKGSRTELFNHIKKQSPDCVVLLGDSVPSGSKASYAKESKLWTEQLGAEGPKVELETLKVPRTRSGGLLPLVGDKEMVSDPMLLNWGSTFPALGPDIGHNRVASWYSVDLVSKGVIWKAVFLNSSKAQLGSRWQEQLDWLDELLGEGSDFEGMLLFFHDGAVNLANPKASTSNPASQELIETIETYLPMMKLNVVFFAGGYANQAILPNGTFGTLHIGAGGGGAIAQDLFISHSPGKAKTTEEKLTLEPVFAQYLLKQLRSWNSQSALPENIYQRAYGLGSYEGFDQAFDKKHFPIKGYWELQLQGKNINLIYHQQLPNNEFHKSYQIGLTDQEGWSSIEL